MTLELINSTGQESQAAPLPMRLRGITVAYGRKTAIFSAGMSVQPGRMTAIVGPNGAGKSTLLKAALGIVMPLAGTAEFFGLPLDAARDRIAYVPQRASVDWDFPVRVIDVVLMGLYPRLGLLGRLRPGHRTEALSCLSRVGMEDFADRQIGQQQRVFLARALVQRADLYLLDEPLAGVDAATEKAIMSVLRALVSEGKTVVAVHHDLNTVEEYFDDVLLLAGQVVAEGPVAETFTPELLQKAYGGRLAGQQGVTAGAGS